MLMSFLGDISSKSAGDEEERDNGGAERLELVDEADEDRDTLEEEEEEEEDEEEEEEEDEEEEEEEDDDDPTGSASKMESLWRLISSRLFLLSRLRRDEERRTFISLPPC